MTPEEIQKKIAQAMEKLSPEQQLELLKTLNGSIEDMNKALTEYFANTEKI